MNDSVISHYRAQQDQASRMGGSTQRDPGSPRPVTGGAPPHIHPIVGGGVWQGAEAPARHGSPVCLGLQGRGPDGDPPGSPAPPGTPDPPGPPAPPSSPTAPAGTSTPRTAALFLVSSQLLHIVAFYMSSWTMKGILLLSLITWAILNSVVAHSADLSNRTGCSVLLSLLPPGTRLWDNQGHHG